MKETHRGMGSPIGENFLFTLNVTNDCVLIVQGEFDLGFVLILLYKGCSNWSLEIKFTKTEYLSTGSDVQEWKLLQL
jgi:hypothetical protein